MKGGSFMLKLFIIKNLKVTLNNQQFLSACFSLSIIVASILFIVVANSFIPTQYITELLPGLFLLVFLLIASFTIEKVLETDFKNDVILNYYFIEQVFSKLYAAQALTNTLLIYALGVFQLIILSVFINSFVLLQSCFAHLILLSVSFSYASLSTLFAGLAQNSRLKNLFIPIAILPFLFPLLFAAYELLSLIHLQQDLVRGEFWLVLLLFLNVVYFLLGINLYAISIKGVKIEYK